MVREHNLPADSSGERVKTAKKTKGSNQNGKYVEPHKGSSDCERHKTGESPIKGEPRGRESLGILM